MGFFFRKTIFLGVHILAGIVKMVIDRRKPLTLGRILPPRLPSASWQTGSTPPDKEGNFGDGRADQGGVGEDTKACNRVRLAWAPGFPPTLQSGAIGVNQIPRPPLADTPFWKGGEKRVAIYMQAGLRGSVSVCNESPGGAEGIPKVG